MNYKSQRPVAWTAGSWNDDTCVYEDEMVWTSGTSDGSANVDTRGSRPADHSSSPPGPGFRAVAEESPNGAVAFTAVSA